MKVREVKQIVKQMMEGGDTTTLPRVKPGLTPAPDKRPNPLTPPKSAPKTGPKAFLEEDERGIVDKIAKRYSSLK